MSLMPPCRLLGGSQPAHLCTDAPAPRCICLKDCTAARCRYELDLRVREERCVAASLVSLAWKCPGRCVYAHVCMCAFAWTSVRALPGTRMACQAVGQWGYGSARRWVSGAMKREATLMSADMITYMSVRMSTHMSTHMSAHMSAHLSLHACVHARLHRRLHTCLCAHLHTCLHICHRRWMDGLYNAKRFSEPALWVSRMPR